MNRKDFTLSQIQKYPEGYWRAIFPLFVKFGDKIRVGSGVIFSQGFGYEKINNEWVHIPHSGRIIIEDKVEIWDGTNICRGTADNDSTIIGVGTKIDYNVHIAHNVKIGKHCLIIAGSIIGGSAVVGDHCYLGIGCMIKNKIKIGNNVTIGMGAVVIKDVPDNVTVIGNPARAL